MNNKIIAAGVVVVLCAVALIGVGYAYTATFENVDNKINSDAQYITIFKDGTGVSSSTVTVSKTDFIIPFDTNTKKDGSNYKTTYTPNITDGTDNWKLVSGTNYTKTIPKTVSVTVDTTKAATPGGSFTMVVTTPASVTPTEKSGVTGISTSVSKIYVGETPVDATDNSNGTFSGTFSGNADAVVTVKVVFNITFTVNKVDLDYAPVDMENVGFNVKYVVSP